MENKELKQILKETTNTLIDGGRVPFMKIEFKVGMEDCEVDAIGNKLGFLLLETLGVKKDKVENLIEKIVRPATTQFNEKLTELIAEEIFKKISKE